MSESPVNPKTVDPVIVELRARLFDAGRIISNLEKNAQDGKQPDPALSSKIESFRLGLRLDAMAAQLASNPHYQEALELAESLKLQFSIVPGGSPRNEDVLWNAMMSLRNALLSPHSQGICEQALRDCDEAVQFVRNPRQPD